MSEKMSVENVGQPGKTHRLDADKFLAMKAAVLAVPPKEPPGMSVADLIEAVKPRLAQDLFPGGETAGWWVKTVQLDLEAKGATRRAPRSPVRLWIP